MFMKKFSYSKLFRYLYYHVFVRKQRMWSNIQITLFFLFYISLTLINVEKNIYILNLDVPSGTFAPLSQTFYQEDINQCFDPRRNFISLTNLDSFIYYLTQFSMLTENHFNFSMKPKYAVVLATAGELLCDAFTNVMVFFLHDIANVSLRYNPQPNSWEVGRLITYSFYFPPHIMIVFFTYALLSLYKNRIPLLPYPLNILTKSIGIIIGFRQPRYYRKRK